MKTLLENKSARLSLFAITLTMIITSIHHIFRLGAGLIIPALIMTALPSLLLRWYADAKSKKALWSYTVYNSLMFIWFGFLDGFTDHVLKALGLENLTFLPGSEAEVVKTVFSLWSPTASNFFYESTGVLTFILGVFAMVFLFQFVYTHIRPSPNRQTSLAKA